MIATITTTLNAPADRVDIRAGLLTPFIWLFAQGFYRWRQYRWGRLLAQG
jgi:hypothetical protein